MIKIFLLIFIFSSFASANNGIIDLGSIEIEGEIRRPLIQYSSTNFTLQNELDYQLTRSFQNFQLGLNLSSNNNRQYLMNLAVQESELENNYQHAYQALKADF